MEEAPRLGHELLVLARQHPRGTWATEARLGDLGRFWLERHAMFRRLEETIRSGTEAGLERRVDPAELLMRRLNGVIDHLSGSAGQERCRGSSRSLNLDAASVNV
jgi:hypothetical protein